jgi:hypothetical protein
MSRPRHSTRSISPKIVAKQHLCNKQQMLAIRTLCRLHATTASHYKGVMFISPSASQRPQCPAAISRWEWKGRRLALARSTHKLRKNQKKVSQIFHHLFPRLAQIPSDLDSLLKRATSFFSLLPLRPLPSFWVQDWSFWLSIISFWVRFAYIELSLEICVMPTVIAN